MVGRRSLQTPSSCLSLVTALFSWYKNCLLEFALPPFKVCRWNFELLCIEHFIFCCLSMVIIVNIKQLPNSLYPFRHLPNTHQHGSITKRGILHRYKHNNICNAPLNGRVFINKFYHTSRFRITAFEKWLLTAPP